jgi:hypothetical protein
MKAQGETFETVYKPIQPVSLIWNCRKGYEEPFPTTLYNVKFKLYRLIPQELFHTIHFKSQRVYFMSTQLQLYC